MCGTQMKILFSCVLPRTQHYFFLASLARGNLIRNLPQNQSMLLVLQSHSYTSIWNRFCGFAFHAHYFLRYFCLLTFLKCLIPWTFIPENTKGYWFLIFSALETLLTSWWKITAHVWMLFSKHHIFFLKLLKLGQRPLLQSDDLA